MASNASPDHISAGQIEGRPATFFYRRDSDAESSAFKYAEGHQTTSTTAWTTIPLDDIICVAGAPYAAGPDEHILIYVEQQNVSQDPKTTPIVSKSIFLQHAPAALVADFALPSSGPAFLSVAGEKSSSPNLHIIVSTGSGTGLALATYEQLLQPVLQVLGLRKDVDFALHFTASETTITELAQSIFLPRANEGSAQHVLLLSGDGGLLDIVNTLLAGVRSADYSPPNVSLLPLGTGNALANSSNVVLDNTLGVRTWLRGTPKKLPLFRTTFSTGARELFNEAREERPLHIVEGTPTAYGAVVCSWGLHAGLVADSDTAEYRKFGVERFKMAAKEALYPSDGSLPHAYKGRVTIQLQPHGEWRAVGTDEHAYVLTTLVSNLEKGFTINPDARPLDNQLRLVHFGPLSGAEAMGIMGKAYQGGQHVEDDRVSYEAIEGLRIQFAEGDQRWRRICIDGKIVRVEEGGWMEVHTVTERVVNLTIP